jgi:hypothetical protein
MPEPARVPETVAAPAATLASAPAGPLTTAAQVLSLSRTAGNQAVVRMIQELAQRRSGLTP